MRKGVFGGWPVRADVVEQVEVVDSSVADQTAVTLEDQPPARLPPGPPVEPPSERDLWPWLLGLLVLVLVGIAVVYFAMRDDANPGGQATKTAAAQPTTVPTSPTTPTGRAPSPSARVTVPRLVGLRAPVALTRLRKVGLAGGTQNMFSEKPANVVVAQTPGASRKVAKGATVMLKVSKGSEPVAVPDVEGQQVGDALSTLHAQGFKPRVVRVPSDELAGQVVAQDPKTGAKARPGAPVRLNVSDGRKATSTGKASIPTTTTPANTEQFTLPATRTSPASGSPLVRVPDLEDMNLSDARQVVRRIGVVIEIRRVPNAQPLGTVIAQAKEPGTKITRGAHLLVTVSKGRKATSTAPPQSSQSTPVPDITGEDEISATEDLENAGFTVQVIDRDTADTSQDGIVIEQAPAANRSAQPNSVVTIYVGRYTSA